MFSLFIFFNFFSYFSTFFYKKVEIVYNNKKKFFKFVDRLTLVCYNIINYNYKYIHTRVIYACVREN